MEMIVPRLEWWLHFLGFDDLLGLEVSVSNQLAYHKFCSTYHWCVQAFGDDRTMVYLVLSVLH